MRLHVSDTPRGVLGTLSWNVCTCPTRSLQVLEPTAPHGGLWTLHLKSPPPTQLTLGPYLVQFWSRFLLNLDL